MEKQQKADTDVTTIQLQVGTRNKLKTFGRKGTSYNEIILDLMAVALKAGQSP